MKRFAEEKLKNWLDNPRRKPLIVWGARQTGKSYLVKDIFAEKYFGGNYVYIDFRLENKVRDFCLETVNPAEILEFISLEKKKKIQKFQWYDAVAV